MNKWMALGLAAVAGVAMADDTARVLSCTPVVQQVPVARQVCTTQPVAVAPQRTGAGALMGALAGGAMGNAVGGGSGRAAATLIGVLGGAMIGDQIEGGGAAQIQNVQQCSTQTMYEERVVAWNVVYEYGGQQHSVQMERDPGPTLELRIAPVGAMPATGNAPDHAVAGYAGATYATAGEAPPAYGQPAYVQPAYATPVVVHTPPVVAAYPPASYFPPINLSLNLGYTAVRGGYRGHHGYWR